jgi:hypothetical protein
VYAVLGVVCLCVVGLLVLALGVGGGGKPKKTGSTTPTTAVVQNTFDPVAGTAPPAPVGLTLVRKGTDVEITWQDASPQPGDFFRVRRTDAGASPALIKAAQAHLTLTGVAAGEKPCVAVVMGRRDGTASPAATGCLA